MPMFMRPEGSCGGRVLVIAAALAVSGCGPTISLNASTNSSSDECVSLAEETIVLTQQLIDIADETGEIDADLTCRVTENELRLLDGACITEADLPEGVDRETLILQQTEFNCPTQ
ncbi:MAG: hypothetical protein IID42_00775 [Planctomycetes bacterium]|nr:hypothetical protein [Planctomycetota bacterium]